MKKNVLKLCLGLLSALVFVSCLDDDDDDTYIAYGVIQNVSSNNQYEIYTDEGNTLDVTKSYTSQTIENGKRVFVNFDILSDKDKAKDIYEVRVNGFYDLLSKPVVKESFILLDEDARRDSIGNDPFNEIYEWFGGDYININFEVFHANNSSKKHMINLIYDDTRSSSDTLYLTLRHNAYGELPNKGYVLYRGVGRCSFKISDLIPTGVKSKIVKLSWIEYGYDVNDVKERSISDVFTVGANTTNDNLSKMTGSNYSSIELK